MSLLREAPKQNTGWTFSVRPQVLLLCRDHVSPVLRDNLSAGQGPSLRAHCSPPSTIAPERSLLVPVCLAPAPPPWRMLSRLLVLSPPPADIITTGSRAASPQSQGITCSVPCPTYTAAPARPPPAHVPAHRAPTAEIFLPTRARGSPTSTAPRLLSWQH